MTPETLDTLTVGLGPQQQQLLPIAFIILTFAIALGLRVEHFAFLRREPRVILGGLAAQFIALPALSLALVFVMTPPPSIALGMLIVAACPGGHLSNLMSWGSRGDVPYSVSLTACATIIACFWTPASILLLSGLYPPTADLLGKIEFDRLAFIIQTTMLLGAPLIFGMICAAWRPRTALAIRKPLALFGGGILAWVILSASMEIFPVLAPGWQMIFIPVLIHNALAFATGALAGRALKAPTERRRTLTFEVGLQNTGIAIVMLFSQMKGLGGATAITVTWAVWHFISGGLLILWFRWLDTR